MTIQKKAEAKLPTHWGDFSVIAYEDEANAVSYTHLRAHETG